MGVHACLYKNIPCDINMMVDGEHERIEIRYIWDTNLIWLKCLRCIWGISIFAWVNSGYIYLCLGTFGYIYLCLGTFGYIYLCLGTFGVYLSLPGYIRGISIFAWVHSGYIYLCLGTFGIYLC